MKSLTSVLFTLDIWNTFEILSLGNFMPMLQIRSQSLRLEVLLGVSQLENGIAGLSCDKAHDLLNSLCPPRSRVC